MKHKYELEYEPEEFQGITNMFNNFIDRAFAFATHVVDEQHKSRKQSKAEDKIEKLKVKLHQANHTIENLKEKVTDLLDKEDDSKRAMRNLEREVEHLSTTVDDLNDKKRMPGNSFA